MPDSDWPQQAGQSQPDKGTLLNLRRLFNTVMDLHKLIEPNVERDRDTFRQILVNTRYHSSILGKEIKRLDDDGFTAHADGMGTDQIVAELRVCDVQGSEWDYRNTCRGILYLGNRWDYATSALFIVLPTDLGSWDDKDPSTHHFRLYFLCDVWFRAGLKGLPQHAHLSNHPGYDLNRPHEFLQTYGNYVLRVLDMMKRGYSDRNYSIPALEPKSLLWGCDPKVLGMVSEDNIVLLVDKAIASLQNLSPPRMLSKLELTRVQSAKIKEYLVVQNGGDTGGDLHRYIRSSQFLSWRCRTHAQQYLEHGSFESLQEFVHNHGGHIDIQKATLRVELESATAAEQFRIVLSDTLHRFDLSVKLNWKATRSDIEELCSNFAKTKAFILEIDGITLDAHPQDHVQHMCDLFGNIILQDKLRFISLLNYPRPLEQCIYTGNCSFRWTIADRPPYSWVDLRSDLEKFSTAVSSAHVSDWAEASRVLLSVLKKHGFMEVTKINVHHKYWEGTFDLEERAFVEAYIYNLHCPTLPTLGSLRRLAVHLDLQSLDRKLYSMVQGSERLQELNISAHRCDLFQLAARVTILRRNFSSPLQLTLLERVTDKSGKMVAKMVIRRDPLKDLLGSRAAETHDMPSVRKLHDISLYAELLLWEYDRIFTLSSDYSAWFLDFASKERPAVLTTFTLDTASLSGDGLACIQRVLYRSSLQCLRIQCNHVTDDLMLSVQQVLRAVQWHTLQSLVFTGENINEWIWLLIMQDRINTLMDLSQLRHLELIDTGPTPQQLAHSTVLFIHRLVCTCPQLELRVENMESKKQDETLLKDAACFADLIEVPLGWRRPHECGVWYLHALLPWMNSERINALRVVIS